MSQTRFLAGASGRVLERSSTARRLSHLQCLRVDLGPGESPTYDRNSSSTSKLHHVSPSLLFSSFYTRTLSTNPPPTPAPAKTTEPPLLLLPTKSANKSAAPSHSQVSASPKPHNSKSPPSLSASQAREELLKRIENAGLIETAKKDMSDAAAHGILVPPPPNAGMLGRLYHQAKELFKFYLAGLKLIGSNRSEALRIKRREVLGGAPLTWKEHRFILRSNSDVNKLAPFLLTLLIIEEIIPLVVMYAPGLLPSTCVLPSQKARIDAKRHERQREAYSSAKSIGLFRNASAGNVQFKSFAEVEIKLLCSTVGISSFGVLGMQRHRLRKYLRAIAEEDTFLLAEGKGAKLNQEEVEEVLWERGFLANSYTPAQQRDRLRWWLTNVKSDSSNTLTLPEDVRARLLLTMHASEQALEHV
ncbi:hypothetical protein DFH11DRAFT_1565287 [Phellopilus nigrolimitatus]|nr:hypothetical protein DFH11DRAFT_1565287 [Phellopilus nigrolimitatus]